MAKSFIVDTKKEMERISASCGDICTVLDENETYINYNGWKRTDEFYSQLCHDIYILQNNQATILNKQTLWFVTNLPDSSTLNDGVAVYHISENKVYFVLNGNWVTIEDIQNMINSNTNRITQVENIQNTFFYSELPPAENFASGAVIYNLSDMRLYRRTEDASNNPTWTIIT